ncbi:MAG: glycosyltransferase involved in cell wall biosynthesis [bacterium]|jgi:glycosyltransferase involved in cell wall biosynthesis
MILQTTDSPLVSIIMPAYNASETILESIQSVLMQTYQNWELLIIDDGSSDNTYEKVLTIQDSRIKAFKEKNKGVATTRNQGIKLAQGKYIAFLDSDDFWLKNKLDYQINYFENTKDNIGLVHSNYKEFDKNGEYSPKPLKHIKNLKIEGNIYEDLVVYDFIATLTVIVTKEALNIVGGFDENLSVAEDWDLWIRITKKFKVGYISKPLAKYRLNPTGLSKSHNKFEKELWTVLERYLLSKNFSKEKQAQGLWLYYRYLAHRYARNFDNVNAFKNLMKAIQAKPIEWKNGLSLGFLLLYFLKRSLQIFR